MDITFFNLSHRDANPSNASYPAFVLVKDGWDDYGYSILFELQYCISRYERKVIGQVKILGTEGRSTALDRRFTALGPEYCSLGQSLEYYANIKNLFPEEYVRILRALNDIVVSPELVDEFNDLEGFGVALLRFGAAEKALKEGYLLLFENMKGVTENLSFTYTTKVPGANSNHVVDFDFSENIALPFRINVLIGKNGTGKTQLLGNMVNAISGVSKKNDRFEPFHPLFTKVISISYSLFDDFPKPENTTVFNYKYIGLRTNKEEKISDEALSIKLRSALYSILEKGREEEWLNSIGTIIQMSNLGLNSPSDLNQKWIDSLSYEQAKRLSSGQSIMLFILSELIANIEYETLVLFDEPETHLHPSAIAQFLNIFYEILKENRSFSIISTHSPLIIQDIPSRYISIFDRVGNEPIVRRLPIESFGENVSVLTNNVFETSNVPELYKLFLRRMFRTNTVKEIQRLFPMGLSLNADLYLEALNRKQSEES